MKPKIYRKFRQMTEEEQRKKLGFCLSDIIREERYLSPEEWAQFDSLILVKEDITEEEYFNQMAKTKGETCYLQKKT